MKFAAITVSAFAMAVAAADTTSYDEELGCWPISVEHDATYCIDGPICSGSGDSPAGSLCPVAGDVAIADCHSYLVSYTEDDNCALPVDTTCQVIKTGAWGCVISSSNSTGSTAGTAGEDVGGDEDEDEGSSSGSTDGEISLSSIAVASSAGSVSAGTIAAIAAVAGVVCVAVGTVIYKKHQQSSAPVEETMVDVVTP